MIQLFLDSINVDEMWKWMDYWKPKYMELMKWLPTTLPNPITSEKLNVDFELHNFGVVIRELRKVSQEFVLSFKDTPNKLNVESFHGAYLFASYLYYRYILKGIDPEPSDVGDIHQVFFFPYCEEIVIERSMSNILYQLRRERGLLEETNIKTFSFVRSL